MNKNEFEFTIEPCKRRSILEICILLWKILVDYTRGLFFLRKIRKITGSAYGVTMFGSARNGLDKRYYDDSELIAAEVSRMGHVVITGGGEAGIMQSSNKGAFEAGNISVGINIYLPHEQMPNDYMTHCIKLDYFPSRKLCLSDMAEVIIYFPGGFGTLDELFTVLTRVHNSKIKTVPIILYGEEFWRPMVEFIKVLDTKFHTIDPSDNDLFVIFDTPNQVIEYIKTKVKRSCT